MTGTRGAGYSYDLYFSELNLAPEDAAIGRDGDVTIVVPAASVDRLRGSRLEFANEGGGGLVLVNPNSPTPEEINPGLPPEILELGVTGPLGSVALVVLEEQVNPSIGCQGCSMSRLTLSQGIETMLREAIPELASVLDVTDHASGENPFYSAE